MPKPQPIKRAVLVYQSGIANIFEVQRISTSPDLRGITQRIFQGDFRTAENMAYGMALAGVEVDAMACNMAGDIKHQPWTKDLDSQPFKEKFWRCNWWGLLERFRR